MAAECSAAIPLAITIPACEEESCLRWVPDEMVPMCSSNYGYRCLAAINAFEEAGIFPDACVFFAGEGANSASEVDTLWRH